MFTSIYLRHLPTISSANTSRPSSAER